MLPKGGRQKKLDFLGDMYPKLCPSAYWGDKKNIVVFYFFINISLEPVSVLRQGGDNTEN